MTIPLIEEKTKDQMKMIVIIIRTMYHSSKL